MTSPFLDESPVSLGAYETIEYKSPAAETQIMPFTEREADLMRNFTENMALWADITDIERHFEIEVPRRALFNQVLRFAIFAFSSRHLNRDAGGDWTEALEYHNRCLKILIPLFSGPDENLTEDVLATVAILRQYEEMDGKCNPDHFCAVLTKLMVADNRFHLTGATRIVNSMTSFRSSGGLGEAAAWLCLRQDIYISLVSQQPLRTRLENFDNSHSFRQQDDLAWANRMVFLLAKVLSCAFTEKSAANALKLRQMNHEVEKWKSTKPLTFEPIKFIQRKEDKDHRFPIIWMLSPFHGE